MTASAVSDISLHPVQHSYSPEIVVSVAHLASCSLLMTAAVGNGIQHQGALVVRAEYKSISLPNLSLAPNPSPPQTHLLSTFLPPQPFSPPYPLHPLPFPSSLPIHSSLNPSLLPSLALAPGAGKHPLRLSSQGFGACHVLRIL